MRILFINRSLNGGGSEKAMSLLANEMVNQGYDITMMLLDNEPKTYFLDERIKLIECYCPVRGNKLVWHVKRIISIRKAIRKIPVKYIISFMWDVNMNVILASFGLKKSVIVSERCDPRREPRKLINFAMLFVLPHAYHTVFQTEEVQRCYPKSVQKRSTVIPNIVCVKQRASEIAERKPEIVAIGRLTEQKNYPMLLKAFAEFHNLYPEYVLRIFGTGNLLEVLTKQAADLGIIDSVVWEGYCASVLDKIKSSRVYVNTSDFEGISNAMLEAMALGLVCICTDCPVGGARLAIKDHEDGILIPVGDQNRLTLALGAVAKDKELEKMLSYNAIISSKRFSSKKISSMWINILR